MYIRIDYYVIRATGYNVYYYATRSEKKYRGVYLAKSTPLSIHKQSVFRYDPRIIRPRTRRKIKQYTDKRFPHKNLRPAAKNIYTIAVSRPRGPTFKSIVR